MANSAVPLVPLKLDKMRHLCCNLNSWIEFERATGKSLQDALAAPTLEDFRGVLWAFLLHEDPGLTLEQVGAMVGVDNVNEVVTLIKQTWNGSQPTAQPAEQETPAPKAPRRPSTGSRSGPSGGTTSDSVAPSSGA